MTADEGDDTMTDQRPVRATVYGAPTGGDPLDLADEDGNPIPNPPPGGVWYGPEVTA